MNETKLCPYCYGEIPANAEKCEHCGELLNESKSTSTSGTESMDSSLTKQSEESLDLEQKESKEEQQDPTPQMEKSGDSLSDEPVLKSPLGGDWHFLFFFFAVLGSLISSFHLLCIESIVDSLSDSNGVLILVYWLNAIPIWIGFVLESIGTAGLFYILRGSLNNEYPEESKKYNLSGLLLGIIIATFIVCILGPIVANANYDLSDESSIGGLAFLGFIVGATALVIVVLQVLCGLRIKKVNNGILSQFANILIVVAILSISIDSNWLPNSIALYAESFIFAINGYFLYRFTMLFGKGNYNYSVETLIYLGISSLICIGLLLPNEDERSSYEKNAEIVQKKNSKQEAFELEIPNIKIIGYLDEMIDISNYIHIESFDESEYYPNMGSVNGVMMSRDVNIVGGYDNDSHKLILNYGNLVLVGYLSKDGKYSGSYSFKDINKKGQFSVKWDYIVHE